MKAPRRLRPVALLASLLAGCAARAPSPVALAPLSPPPGAAGPMLRIHFLDVGQGDAVLLEFPCAAVLVDTGGEGPDPGTGAPGSFDSTAVLRWHLEGFFRRRGDLARTLHLLVLTHSHLDHTRGAPMVMERFRVLNLIDNGREGGSGGRQLRLLHDRVVSDSGVGHRDIRVEDIPPAGGLTDAVIDPVRCADVDPQIRALWGALGRDPGWDREPRHGRWPFQNENNHSVVLRVDFGRASLLLQGDLEEPAIEAMLARSGDLLDVDVYKVGHHGSSNAVTEPLLAALTPRIAVITAGPPARPGPWTAWQFGLPRLAALERLRRHVSGHRAPREVPVGWGTRRFRSLRLEQAIYGTGWDGTVTVDAWTGGALRVTTERQRPRPGLLTDGSP